MGLGSCRLAHRSIRHECLDQIIVLDSCSARCSNYHKWPTDLALRHRHPRIRDEHRGSQRKIMRNS